MPENAAVPKKKISADWLVRGVLTKVGDTFDRLTGRKWIPSSSLATSELIERLKKLLDAEARDVPGKGKVVPHHIKLKIQWDKFSDDSEKAIEALRNELMTAAIDHINESAYYTYAPLSLEVKTDYFTEGVKLLVSFDRILEDDRDIEMNVTIPAMNLAGMVPTAAAAPTTAAGETFIARFKVGGVEKEVSLTSDNSGRMSVGRTGENTLAIEDPSVSKMHAALVVAPDGGLSVADTGSTNGTFVNGERIAYGKTTAIEGDDTVKFGTVEVRFEHIPRPITAIPEESQPEGIGEATEIDGMEFRRRETPQTEQQIDVPAEVLTEHTVRIDPTAPESAPAPALPEHTMRVDAPAPAPIAVPAPSAPLPDHTMRVEPSAPVAAPAPAIPDQTMRVEPSLSEPVPIPAPSVALPDNTIRVKPLAPEPLPIPAPSVNLNHASPAAAPKPENEEEAEKQSDV